MLACCGAACRGARIEEGPPPSPGLQETEAAAESAEVRSAFAEDLRVPDESVARVSEETASKQTSTNKPTSPTKLEENNLQMGRRGCLGT